MTKAGRKRQTPAQIAARLEEVRIAAAESAAQASRRGWRLPDIGGASIALYGLLMAKIVSRETNWDMWHCPGCPA